MDFDPTASFEDNLDRFRTESERLDPECAHILFGNLAILTREGDGTRIRQATQEFNSAVLAALDALPDIAP